MSRGVVLRATSHLKEGNPFYCSFIALVSQLENPKIAMERTGNSIAAKHAWLKVNARTRLGMKLMRVVDLD